ncbi:phosphorylcholine transferase LicD [Azonexus sp.]|uniref:LicD family protein n=1 Tax=Azonexus sp. TaxID=1872668 RepID=UPI0035B12B5A
MRNHHPKHQQTTLRKIQIEELKILEVFHEICLKNKLKYWLDGGTLLGAVRHQGFIPWDDDVDIAMPRADYQIFIKAAQKSLPNDLELEISNESQDDILFWVPCKIRQKHSKITATDNINDKNRGLFIDIIPIDQFHSGKIKYKIDIFLKWLYRTLSKIKESDKKNSPKIYKIANRFLTLTSPLAKPDLPIKIYYKFIKNFVINQNSRKSRSELVGYGFDVYWTRIFRSSDIFPLRTIEFEGMYFSAPQKPEKLLEIFYGPYFMTPPPIEEQKPRHVISVIFDTRTNDPTHFV